MKKPANSIHNQQNYKLKQRLYRIKTEHDQSANINKQLFYEETKNLHRDNVNYAIYAEKKADQLFALKPVDIGFVQSLTLKDDPKFKEIRHLLLKYNEQVLQYDEKSYPGLHLKTKVIDSMLKFMRLMLQAPDSTAKKRILDVAYYWFKKNLDNENGKKRSQKSMEKQIRTILVESNLVPKSIIDRELPTQKRKQQLEDFIMKARTRYPEINPPGVELENFVTHKLGFANNGQLQKSETENQNQIKTKEQIREEKWKKRIVFKKPYIYEPNYDDLDDEKLGDQDSNVLKEKQENNILQQQSQNGKTPQGTEQQPGTQNSPQDGQNVQQQQAQLDMGIPEQPDEGGDDAGQLQEEQEKQKRGKLDPLVKIFLKDRQKRLKTEGQITADQRYTHTQNWKLQQKRIDQINAGFMTQWAGNRCRFKSELSRKIQSIRTFTSVTKAKQQARQQGSLGIIRVEHTINKARLNETLKQYGSYLHNEPIIKDTINAEQSMSVFDRKRAKTEVMEVTSTLKPFSAVLEDNKRLDQRSQYLQEIHKLKEKFAKYKLFTPLDSFKNAIIHPEEKQCNWKELDKQLSDGIELPRSQMLSNPFFKIAKKKKKKGKKK